MIINLLRMRGYNMIVSQRKSILNYMQKGYKITPLEALKKFGCLRLGARIYDLKQQGFEIKARMIEKNKKRYAQYYMEVDRCKN